ncbi:hypothetical protein VPH35_069241 [Triticum aestivum]
MATHSPPSPKRKRDSEPPPAPTSLVSLGDDMLAEILRRLPSLPSLASAAFASPRLYSVASSPAVSNCFVSRASLLGYFVSVADGAAPIFHRALLRRDRHLAAIVRRGDFHLTFFEEYKWRLMDCRHGLLLLRSDRRLVVFDPVSSSRRRITHKSISSNSFHCFLPPCSSGPTSFRVLSLENRGGRVHAHVYISRTGEWCSSHSPSPKGITVPRNGHRVYLKWPMNGGDCIYWISQNQRLTSLDVGSMEFSHIDLPEKVSSDPRSYAVGDAEDGTTCLVDISSISNKLVLGVWFRKENKSWELQWEVDASEWSPHGGSSVKKVCNVTAGVVLLCMGFENRGLHYIAFRLKNAGSLELEADFFTSDGWVHPYFMAWPRPSLKAGRSKRKKTSLKDQEAGGSKKKTSLKDQENGSSKKN